MCVRARVRVGMGVSVTNSPHACDCVLWSEFHGSRGRDDGTNRGGGEEGKKKSNKNLLTATGNLKVGGGDRIFFWGGG